MAWERKEGKRLLQLEEHSYPRKGNGKEEGQDYICVLQSEKIANRTGEISLNNIAVGDQ